MSDLLTGSAVGRLEVYDGAFCLHDERANVRLWLVSPQRSVVVRFSQILGDRVLLTFQVTRSIGERFVIPLQIQRCPEEYHRPQLTAEIFTPEGVAGLYRANHYSSPHFVGYLDPDDCDDAYVFLVSPDDFAHLYGQALGDRFPCYEDCVITARLEILDECFQIKEVLSSQSIHEWSTAKEVADLFALPSVTDPDAERLAKPRRRAVSTRLRYEIFRRDGHRCVDCGASAQDDPYVRLEIDHRIPVSKGGTNDPENLQTLCWACNNGKSDRVDHKLEDDVSCLNDPWLGS